MPAVKFGKSRQVVIPKKLSDALGLLPGEYLDVEIRGGKLIFTPKVLIDKVIKKHLAEGLEDIRKGRVLGPFDTATEAMSALRAKTKPQ